MTRHDEGPYRSSSVNSYLAETRALGAVALLALIGGVVLDEVARNFWTRNALIAGLLSSLIVVILSVAVVNEALERRNRRRWSVLAQYVMLQLVRQARLVWTGVMELSGLMPADATDAPSIDTAARAVRDTPRLKAAIGETIADTAKRRRLHEAITAFVVNGDEVLGRWAGVMLSADAYAEIIDRHVGSSRATSPGSAACSTAPSRRTTTSGDAGAPAAPPSRSKDRSTTRRSPTGS